MFLRPADIESRIVHQLIAAPSRLYSFEGVRMKDGSPASIHSVSQPIPSQRNRGEDIPLEEIAVVIGDFGYCEYIKTGVAKRLTDSMPLCEAHLVEKPPNRAIQPRTIRAPEVFIGYPYDTSVDIWSLGCLARLAVLKFCARY